VRTINQRRQHLINLFVWPAAGPSIIGDKFMARQGYNLVHWTQAGMTFWAVSDLNPTDLAGFAQLLK
jgi:anti-sigma factor RsiW